MMHGTSPSAATHIIADFSAGVCSDQLGEHELGCFNRVRGAAARNNTSIKFDRTIGYNRTKPTQPSGAVFASAKAKSRGSLTDKQSGLRYRQHTDAHCKDDTISSMHFAQEISETRVISLHPVTVTIEATGQRKRRIVFRSNLIDK